MNIEVSNNNDWVFIGLEDRLDAFNYEEFKSKVQSIVSEPRSYNLAFNLEKVKFLSLPGIQYLSSVAKEVKNKGGEFALVATPEKLKRQIDIYASLKPMKVYRSVKDWEKVLQRS